jgi:hypothetical protein
MIRRFVGHRKLSLMVICASTVPSNHGTKRPGGRVRSSLLSNKIVAEFRCQVSREI